MKLPWKSLTLLLAGLAASALAGEDKNISSDHTNAATARALESKIGGKASESSETRRLEEPRSAKRATIYPFDVRVGGQLAVVEGDPTRAIFAKIKEPVDDNAQIEIGGEPGMLIVNVFPVRPNGEVPQGAPTKVMFVQNGTKTRLDETMDKSRLAPGLYGANVVYANATSRVMFEVK